MFIVKLKGGLGNQLFQYSFGRLMSVKRDEIFKLDKDVLGSLGDTQREYSLDNFNISASIASPEEVARAKYPYGLLSKICRFISFKFLRIFHIGYEKNILKSKAKYFDGFFQSYRYLDPIRSELLREISIKGGIRRELGVLIDDMASSNSVSIHVRRGDYVENKKTKKDHFVCNDDYYKKAISLITNKVEKPRFFIFSDDINWVKENFSLSNVIFVSDQGLSDYEELILMSHCKHNIIANSSFSFWAAWLNNNGNKIIIAPKIWNRRYDKHYKDLAPLEWIRI